MAERAWGLFVELSAGKALSIGILSAIIFPITRAHAAEEKKPTTGTSDLAYLSTTLAIQPSPLTYGHVAQEVVTLFLSDPSRSLTITSASGAADVQFGLTADHCTGVTLTAHLTCQIDITYVAELNSTPVTLTLGTNEGSTTLGVGPTSTPALDLIYTPDPLDFGSQPLLTPMTGSIVITNPNPAPLELTGGFLPLYGSDEFINHELIQDSPNCAYIEASGSCTIAFRYAPTRLGFDAAQWDVPANYTPNGYAHIAEQIKGTAIQDAVNVDLTAKYNVVALASGTSSGPIIMGGIDGEGDAYPDDFLTAGNSYVPGSIASTVYLHEQFAVGNLNALDAVTNETIVVSAGYYYGLTLLGTAVHGPHLDEAIVLTYMDGSKTTVRQSFSDWKNPQHFAAEGVAQVVPTRVTHDGVTRMNGPYYLYGYTVPVDHTKLLASVQLPGNRYVIALAINLETTPRPIPVDLSSFYNIAAIRRNAYPDVAAFDGQRDALPDGISLLPQTGGDFLYLPPPPDVPNAVVNETVSLPAGTYTQLRLLGLAVNGAKLEQPMTINYSDGTSTAVKQSFSDWHYTKSTDNLGFNNGLAGESNAILLPYRTTFKNLCCSTRPIEVYMIYEYAVALDPTKSVLSVVLPPNKYVGILAMAVVPK